MAAYINAMNYIQFVISHSRRELFSIYLKNLEQKCADINVISCLTERNTFYHHFKFSLQSTIFEMKPWHA